jgi:hypothetical protein
MIVLPENYNVGSEVPSIQKKESYLLFKRN